MRELLQIESDALTRGHLINTQLPDDPLLPLADTDKKSLNLGLIHNLSVNYQSKTRNHYYCAGIIDLDIYPLER